MTKIQEIWTAEWLAYPEARQSTLYFPDSQPTFAKHIIQWPRLKLGRLIRAITGHNNLLYHLHNIQPDISPLCRFCLQDNEEFHHLQRQCPALYWDRHEITATNPDHTDNWTPEQIVDFTFIPKINDAFIKPLYNITEHTNPRQLPSQTISLTSQHHDDNHSNPVSELSIMDISSITSSELDSEYDPMEQ